LEKLEKLCRSCKDAGFPFLLLLLLLPPPSGFISKKRRKIRNACMEVEKMFHASEGIPYLLHWFSVSVLF